MRIPKAYIDRTLRNIYESLDTEIDFYPYNSSPSNLYGETLNKTFGTPVKVIGYLEMDPTTLRLKDLGWDLENINLIIHVPFATLVNVGLANTDGTINFDTNYKIGVPTYNKEYQLVDYQLKEPFVNGQSTLVYITARKYVDGR